MASAVPSGGDGSASLFGIPLPPEAATLLEEIERDFGKPVREEWLDPADARQEPGNSNVADDGTPIIRINPKIGRTLDVIVHELYHFRLRVRGYPILNWSFPRDMDIPSNRTSFEQLREQHT